MSAGAGFLAYRPSFEKERIVGALAYGWHVFKCEHPDLTFWHKIGFFYGGVLGFAYVLWIGLKAKEMGFDHLMLRSEGRVDASVCEEEIVCKTTLMQSWPGRAFGDVPWRGGSPRRDGRS